MPFCFDGSGDHDGVGGCCGGVSGGAGVGDGVGGGVSVGGCCSDGVGVSGGVGVGVSGCCSGLDVGVGVGDYCGDGVGGSCGVLVLMSIQGTVVLVMVVFGILRGGVGGVDVSVGGCFRCCCWWHRCWQ